MPVETLQHPSKQPAKAAVGVSPPRLRPKALLGPDFYRKAQSAPNTPKQSAVERLEADKAKYVKSQVALSKQQTVRAPEMKKPLLNPNSLLRPTRKKPTQVCAKQDGVQLDMGRLSSLIGDLNKGTQPGVAARSGEENAPDGVVATHDSPSKPPAHVQPVKEKPRPPPRPILSSAAKVKLKASGPATVDGAGSAGAPVAGTVRRVDVVPQADPVRAASRPTRFMRVPLQPVPLHSQFPLRLAISRQRLFIQKINPDSSLKQVVPPKLENCSPGEPSAPSSSVFPPPSPAITRLSSSSSRKRPSLTRSKSDMSDRYSRAGGELERFFNLCGLEPSDLQDPQASGSDVVSLARFRSVSTPGSECGGSNRGGKDEVDDEGAGKVTDRVPYGVSVIEKNARVIKWLYGLRQAKENTASATKL